MKLRGKILLAFLLVSLPLIVVDALWLVRHYRADRAETFDWLRGEAEGASGIVRVFLRDLAARGEQTARNLPQGNDLQVYLTSRLADLRRWNAGIVGLASTDATGAIMASVPPELFRRGRRVLSGDDFPLLRRREGWEVYNVGSMEAQGGPLPLVSMLTLDREGTSLGGILIALQPETFLDLFPHRATAVKIRLADRTGHLVFATDLTQPSLAERERWAKTPGVRAALQAGAATDRHITLAGPSGGAEGMAAHVRIPQVGWTASAVIPAAEVMRPAREAFKKEVVSHAFLLALCVAAALVLARHVAEPARRLAQAAQRIAAGDRAARVGFQGRDELGTLGRAFDEMAEALHSSWGFITAQRDTLEDTAARLATLNRLAGEVSSALDTRRVFEHVVEAASRLLHGAVALLVVADEQGDTLHIRSSYGLGRPELRSQNSFRRGEGLCGWVYQQREPLVLTDMLADARTLNRAWIEAGGLGAFAGLPIVLHNRCLGVLCVMRPGDRPFDAPDVDLLAALAAHAATAIQNARLHEKTEAEREEFRALIEAMPEAVRVAEGDTATGDIRLRMANRACWDLLRASASSLNARTPDYQVAWPDGTPLQDGELPLQRAIWQGEATRGMELLVRFDDGTRRSLLANAVPLREVAGMRRAVVVFQDITEPKLAEEALRASEERLRAILEAMPEAMAMAEGTPGGGEIRLVYGNRARRELLRISGQVFGARTPHYEFVRLDGTPLDDAQLPLRRAIWRGEATHGMELAVRFPDGSRRFLLANAAPLPDSAGRRRAVAVFQDITERKRAEEALKQSEARYRVLADIARLISSRLELPRVLDSVAEASSRLLEGAPALLFLADEKSETVAICASHGVKFPALRSQNAFHAGEGFPGIVLQTKKPIVLENVRDDPRALNRAWLEAEGLQAFVGVPLLFRDRCLGVLFAARDGDRRFEPRDVDLLEAFAAHAAIAIQNASLFERAKVEGKRLRALVEAMPEAVVVGEVWPGDNDIRIVMWNRAHAELLRIPELVSEAPIPPYEFLGPDGRPIENEELALERAIWQGKVTRGMEIGVLFPDGNRRVLLANAAPLPERDGVRQAVAVLQDITQRKLAEEALRASEERFRRIADSNMIGISFFGIDGNVTEANQAYLNIIGYSREDLSSGRFNWRKNTPAEDAHLDEWALREMQETGVCTPFEKELIRQDGRRVPVLIGAALLEKSRQEGVAFVLDLTERKRVEEELRRLTEEVVGLYERAAREARVKGLLLEELNHRVRNNLALIVSFMELQKQRLGEREATALEDALARVQGLARIHNALASAGFQALDYGPLARGLAEETFLRGPLAGRVVFRMDGVRLRLPSVQLTALGLITNELFTNVAKHAFSDGRAGSVEVNVERAVGEVTVRVRDDGVGLPRGFARQPGHLGLSLIHSLVQASLKGTFALESDGGTTAVIQFPDPGESVGT